MATSNTFQVPPREVGNYKYMDDSANGVCGPLESVNSDHADSATYEDREETLFGPRHFRPGPAESAGPT